MESEERKIKFIELLSEMLSQSNDKKSELAQKLGIKAPTLTGWFQGKVDPANLDILVFERIAKAKNCSVDDLAKLLSLFDREPKTSLEKLKNLITERLSKISLEQLGQRLKISKSTIEGWLYPGKNIDPGKLSAGTIAILAQDQKWTIEELLVYLDLKKPIKEKTAISRVRKELSSFSLIEQIEILSWLSTLVEEKIKYSTNLEKIIENKSKLQYQINDLIICVILEQEDLSIASNYSSNFVRHLEIEPENITIATIQNLPDSLEDIDVLIVDVSNADSPNLALIKDLEFDGDIVVFSAIDLSEEVRGSIGPFVTDVVLKPVDWQQLKEKEYFG